MDQKSASDELRERKQRAVAWKKFRRDYLFTQRKLAEMVGVSRRTVQLIEAGKLTPRPSTLRLFATYRKQCRQNPDI